MNPAEIRAAVEARTDPDLLVISATMAFHADNVRTAVIRIRTIAPGLPIAVGGQVCEWVESLGRELDLDLCGCDAAELVRDARALLRIA